MQQVSTLTKADKSTSRSSLYADYIGRVEASRFCVVDNGGGGAIPITTGEGSLSVRGLGFDCFDDIYVSCIK